MLKKDKENEYSLVVTLYLHQLTPHVAMNGSRNTLVHKGQISRSFLLVSAITITSYGKKNNGWQTDESCVWSLSFSPSHSVIFLWGTVASPWR